MKTDYRLAIRRIQIESSFETEEDSARLWERLLSINKIASDAINCAPDLLAENERLKRAINGLLRHCVTVDGMPDKDKGRTSEQQQALDAATAALNPLKP